MSCDMLRPNRPGATRGDEPLGYIRAMLLLLVIAALLLPASAIGQSTSVTQYETKAAFLYNFAKFVEWPSSSFASLSSSLRICVLGHDPIGPELSKLARGKMMDQHPLEVRNPPNATEARNCHIVFIAADQNVKLSLEALRGCSVLTVGDTDGFIREGGITKFVLREDRLHFQIDVKAAERAGLKISSKLLRVAIVIE